MPIFDHKNRQFMMNFPSKEDRERWRGIAKKHRLPFATWIYNYVELHLKQDEEADKIKLPREIDEVRKENHRLHEELREKTLLLERQGAELYKQQYSGFAEVDSEEADKYDTALVELLRRGRTVDGREILEALQIPPQDGQAMRLVYNQLEELRRFGFVKETANGWRWNKK